MTTKPEIVLGSRNVKKCREIAPLLLPYGIDVLSLADFPDVPEVVEDGETFDANAVKKATETAAFLSRWVLAEDSGLVVEALQGRPGVYSARYSGPNATDASNNQRLIADLADVPEGRRCAHYVCHMAVADPTGEIRLQVEESCWGRITTTERGTNGFGYDPYFLIPEYHQTFGELSPLVKSLLSHRARALRRLVPELVGLVCSSNE